MTWPRGKYNGLRIVGIDVKVNVNIRQWRWWAYCRFGTASAGIGPVRLWASLAYEDWRPR